MLNEVKVMICGKEYKLRTAESPNYVYSLARVLESKIDEIVNAGSGSSPYTASIMVALSLLDDLNKSNQRLDNIRSQTKEYVDEAGKTRIERDAAVKEIEALKAKIVQLENMVKLRQLKDSIGAVYRRYSLRQAAPRLSPLPSAPALTLYTSAASAFPQEAALPISPMRSSLRL